VHPQRLSYQSASLVLAVSGALKATEKLTNNGHGEHGEVLQGACWFEIVKMLHLYWKYCVHGEIKIEKQTHFQRNKYFLCRFLELFL
jgi:hypothetical protein